MKPGRLITFEGGDGVGKSTQIQRLAARLKENGITCQLTREPGGTPFAERVRTFVLDGTLPPHPALAEALMFAAARHDHVTTFIQPALMLGDWVLSDRFSDSTHAYQGVAGGADIDALVQLDRIATGTCRPDLTLVLDLEPEAGRARISAREGGREAAGDDPFERRSLDFQRRLRGAFLEIAAREPQRCGVIDAGGEVERVAGDVWAMVQQRLMAGAR